VLSVVGKALNNVWIGQVATVAFLGAVGLYVAWRRQVAARRRTMVLDSEAKTDETRTGPDE
jgi:hypothetical protein